MFYKNLTAALIALSLMSGCSTLSNEQSANLDRDVELERIILEIDDVGYEPVAVSPGIDQLLNSISAYLKHQKGVADDYREIVKNHRDVTTFLVANKGKTEQELQAEAARFDLGAANEKNKIAYKLAAYRTATETISEENTKLGIDLLKKSGELALLVTQYGTEIAKVAAINTAMSFFKKDDADEKLTIPTAIMRAKDQISLLDEIHGLIKADQEVADSLNTLQEQLDTRG